MRDPLARRAPERRFDAYQAMLALVRHDPEREQLQRVLLDVVSGSDRDLAQLAVTCLGHVGRIDREVLPEVVPALRELLGDPQLGGRAEDALGDIEHFARHRDDVRHRHGPGAGVSTEVTPTGVRLSDEPGSPHRRSGTSTTVKSSRTK
ncbi:hypothetical protein [Lentzea sp. CC55]|uniref:hypothetical protein n=1 Tax=Lentzea sp. CC55 TaxID=2884909 RepID=UPI001F19E353|nr:hypothetical protein [Lentzea sp. CC55]MCG8922061.1 hypothetical protein [Lentzea sp. CC55]